MEDHQSLSGALLSWYDQHHRILPWRGLHDPYATWVSEIMLQQTRVDTVIPYFERFMTAFPTVTALADAQIDQVLKLWEGLGYYRRAQNLHRGAKQVADDYAGVMPSTVTELLKIHGIGDYTAGAIASIAFGQPVPAVDGNVIRVVSRLFGIRENAALPDVRKTITDIAASQVPADRPGDFNQALMDLGAMVCTPGTPDCTSCPLSFLCDACRAGDAEDLPVLPRKKSPRVIPYDVLLILNDRHQVLVHKRTEKMLEGLWVFPMVQEHHDASLLPLQALKLTHVETGDFSFISDARHVFTHQIWEMKLYAAHTTVEEAPQGWRFIDADELAGLAFPTAMAKARSQAALLMADHA